MRADLAIIGGEPEQRLIYAVNLRRKGMLVATETVNRKRRKMFKAAVDETGDPKNVIDLDHEEGRARLTSLLSSEFKIEMRRTVVFAEHADNKDTPHG